MRLSIIVICVLIVGVVCKPRNGAKKNKNQRDSKKWTKTEVEEAILKHWPRMSKEEFDQMEVKLKARKEKAAERVRKGKKPEKASRRPKFNEEVGGPKSEAELNAEIADLFYESDLLLTLDQLQSLDDKSGSRKKRKAIHPDYSSYKWPGNHVSYTLDASLTTEKIGVIREAVQFWRDETCLTFTENGGGDSIEFFNGGGCYSSLGHVGGQQSISIGDGCQYLGIVAHEIGHALGFFHEQSRYDRDDYVTVISSNIQSDYLGQYNKETSDVMSLYNVPYEYGSVMHYADGGFAIDTSASTLTADDARFQQTMGQRTQPSFLDVLTMNEHYQCNAACAGSGTTCNNNGYPDPNNCAVCKCPGGFAGANCDQRQADQTMTCGADLPATTSWQTFGGIVGTNTLDDELSVCFWHIKGPTGTQIEVKTTLVSGICSNGCFWSAIEIKPFANFAATGIRQCCSDSPNLNTVFTSPTNLVPVMVEGEYAIQFSFEYRYVGQPTTDAPVTDAPTEPPTDAPTEPPTDAPTEPPTDAPTEPPTDEPNTDAATTEATTTVGPTGGGECPSRGVWSSWGAYSKCTDTCGGCGTKTRSRTCLSAAYDCACKGKLEQTPYCRRRPCKNRDYKCCDPFVFGWRWNAAKSRQQRWCVKP